MARRRISLFEYRKVITLLREQVSVRGIARRGIVSRKKAGAIKKKARELGWLNPARELPPDKEIAAVFVCNSADQVPRQTSLVEPHRAKVEEWVEKGYQATTILDKLERDYNFKGSYGSVLRFVQKVKSQHPRVYVPLDFSPGELTQVDFGGGPLIFDPDSGKERKTHVFVMTLAYSRHMYAELVWDQKVETWLRCHRNGFEFLGGFTARVRMDNLKAAIIRACRYDPVVQRSYDEFAEAYGFLIDPIEKRTPRHNGRVERGVGFVKKSFLPLRTFRSLADGNRQLLDWILGPAGNRVHGTTKRVPLTLFAEEEKAQLKPLPSSRIELVHWAQAKLHPNCLLTYQKAFYSAPHTLVHKTLDLRVGESLVEIYHRYEQVAVHARATRPGQRRINEAHLPPEKQAWLMRTPRWCIEQAHRIGPACARFIEELFNRGVVYNLRAAQGTIRFADSFGKARLNAACQRALAFDNITYHAIKRILKKGLDQAPLDEGEGGQLHFQFIEAPTYARDIGKMLSQ